MIKTSPRSPNVERNLKNYYVDQHVMERTIHCLEVSQNAPVWENS